MIGTGRSCILKENCASFNILYFHMEFFSTYSDFQLFVRAFAIDGSSKSIMVDEKMSILEVIAVLADKNHVKLHPDLAVIEHMPELYMGKIMFTD